MRSGKMPRMKALPLLFLLAAGSLVRAETIADLDAEIHKLESKLASLTALIRPRCLDDIPILQKKLEQVNMDIEQARKGESRNAVAHLEELRDQTAKALDDLSPDGDGLKIKEVAAQIVEVKGELTKLKMERLKKEIEKRDQELQNIVLVMKVRFRCGADLDEANSNLDEANSNLDAARKKLVEARAVGDKEAAQSAEGTIQRATAFLEEWKKPMIDGVPIETLSEDINRLKKEKLELEAKLDDLFWGGDSKQP